MISKKPVVRNISYTLTSNLVSFLISSIVTFFVPKFLGVENYGYFQLYIFYTGYTGFLHFGWADGVFLRYGGEYYDKLDRPKMSGQFWGLLIFEIFVAIAISLFAVAHVSPESKQYVVFGTAIYIILVLPRTLLQFILQGTNRIKEYSTLIITERVVYLVLVVIIMVLRQDSFIPIIIADCCGKLASFLLSVYYCRELIFCIPERLGNIITETYTNISVGIKVMLSSIAGMLIIGIVRYSIEHKWDVATFGRVSLSMSVSNMLLLFVSAVSLVMFPALKRTNREKYADVYNKLRNALMVILLGMLVVYYPVMRILSAWLPQYAESLRYMAILFPVCIFESKYSMLISTYLKAMRKEKVLLFVNLCTMLASVVITWITVYSLGSINLAILSIVILVAIRSIIAELLISRVIEIQVKVYFYQTVTCETSSYFIPDTWGAEFLA